MELALPLPAEVCLLIRRHRAALFLQRVARGRLARERTAFLRRLEWPALKSLVERRGGSVKALSARAAVRREWTTEPGSWIATLSEPDGAATLALIAQECIGGAWD